MASTQMALPSRSTTSKKYALGFACSCGIQGIAMMFETLA